MLVKEVTIKNFRGISGGLIKEFKDINIFIGRNNTGKSTILEALYLALTACNIDILKTLPLQYLAMRRGWFGLSTVLKLFYRNSEASEIILSTVNKGKQELTIKRILPFAVDLETLKLANMDTSRLIAIHIQAIGYYTGEYRFYFDEQGKSHYFLLPNARGQPIGALLLDWNRVYSYGNPEDCYSALMEIGGSEAKKSVIDVIKERYEEIEDIGPLKEGDRWILHVVHRGYSLPFYVMGDGFKYALMYLMLLNTAKDVLLLEEPELHQHVGLLRLIAKAIIKARERAKQIMISTHSIELIDMLLEEAEKQGILDNIAIYRTTLEEGVLNATRYEAHEAIQLRRELEYDLRG